MILMLLLISSSITRRSFKKFALAGHMQKTISNLQQNNRNKTAYSIQKLQSDTLRPCAHESGSLPLRSFLDLIQNFSGVQTGSNQITNFIYSWFSSSYNTNLYQLFTYITSKYTQKVKNRLHNNTNYMQIWHLQFLPLRCCISF